MNNPNLPQFLLIGAMKAGTTTLYSDLNKHPDIEIPDPKESWILTNSSSEAEALSRYRRYYSNVPRGKVIGDATTCLLYTSPSPRDGLLSRMPSSA